MAHTRVKFKSEHEDDEVPKGWHLLSKTGDGEYTACGLATPEYVTVEEEKEKGGITCPECLKVIRYYKSVKL